MCTPKVTREPCACTHPSNLGPDRLIARSPDSLVCNPQGTQPAALPSSEAQPAHPSQPGLSAPPPPPERKEALRERPPSRQPRNLPAPLYLQQSLGRCRGRSSRAHPAPAAACRPGSTTSVGPWVLGGSSRGQVDRLLGSSASCPRTQAGREARCRPSDLSMVGRQPLCAFYTSVPADASHACARLRLPHPKDMQERGCAHRALDGASPAQGLAALLWLAFQGACSFLREYFRKKCLFPRMVWESQARSGRNSNGHSGQYNVCANTSLW